MGGIKSVLVANPDAVTIAASGGVGTATLAPATPGAKPFYRWDVASGQSTLTTEAQIDEANNVRFFRTDLAAVLNGFDPTTAGANLLSRLSRLLFIVECKNGQSYLVGLATAVDDKSPSSGARSARGADVINFSWTPGQANADATRATITARLDSFLTPLVVSGYSALVND